MRMKLACIFAFSLTLLCTTPVFAGTEELKFDIAKLCEWQAINNSMNPAECGTLEQQARNALPALEKAADDEREKACVKETANFSGDSGFASYWVYANCLKDGAGAL
jgi:hypothetical protein